MTPEPSEGEPKASPKPRATIAKVDAKVEQIIEEIDGIRIEMSQIKSAIKELVTFMVSDQKPKPPSDGDFTMFG